MSRSRHVQQELFNSKLIRETDNAQTLVQNQAEQFPRNFTVLCTMKDVIIDALSLTTIETTPNQTALDNIEIALHTLLDYAQKNVKSKKLYPLHDILECAAGNQHMINFVLQFVLKYNHELSLLLNRSPNHFFIDDYGRKYPATLIQYAEQRGIVNFVDAIKKKNAEWKSPEQQSQQLLEKLEQLQKQYEATTAEAERAVTSAHKKIDQLQQEMDRLKFQSKRESTSHDWVSPLEQTNTQKFSAELQAEVKELSRLLSEANLTIAELAQMNKTQYTATHNGYSPTIWGTKAVAVQTNSIEERKYRGNGHAP